MDFKKLENISQELSGNRFSRLESAGVSLLVLEVYKNIYTIEEAKEILQYVGFIKKPKEA